MRRYFLLAGLFMFIALQGCATIEGTATGVKKDAEAAWNYMNKEDGWIKKTDNWMKEHLW